RLAASPPPTVAVPAHPGLPGAPVTESDLPSIFAALGPKGTEVGVIDLEQGQAWWETRLLILVAGAARLGKPPGTGFIANDGGTPGVFQGWAPPEPLLAALLQAEIEFRKSFDDADAAARQAIQQPGHKPPAIQPAGQIINFTFEEKLAGELGKLEMQRARPVSIVRLQELFRPVLRMKAIEETSPAETQLTAFFEGNASYIAITDKGCYKSLLPQLMGLQAI